MSRPPCIRHGVRGIADDRVVRALDLAEQGLSEADRGGELVSAIESLVDFDGQLWATWRSGAVRGRLSGTLDRAWTAVGGERGTLQLVRSDEDYDYQEDCMNDASPVSASVCED